MTDFAVVRVTGQIGIRQSDDLQFLAAIDGIDSVPGPETLPCFHFDEDQQSAAPDDQSDLAASQPDVPLHDSITA